MNGHALDVLEYREALETVAAFASSDLGADAVRRLSPGTALEPIRAELALVSEAVALVAADAWIMPVIPDLREPLERLPLEGYVWDGPSLRRAATLITSSRSLRRTVLGLGERAGPLVHEVEALVELPGTAEDIVRVVGDDGEVRDGATPELARLRREIHGARSRIVGRLNAFVAGLPQSYQVSDGSVSIREGRYVVPVRREARGEVGGIVHGESQTGATLFIEPPIAIEMMNRLRELEAAEAREVHRVLREATDRLRPHAWPLRASLAALVRLDTIHARARYAIRVGGHKPDLLPPGAGTVALVDARHPLLLAQGAAVVPFDLGMEEDERTLIISGPNTGGKTVLLKGLGLISMLSQAGIVPPVGPGGRVPFFSPVSFPPR
jgi:DNA mismatch repair protein MutS2